MVSRTSDKTYPEIVTAVGFCMYMRDEVLAQVGYFDEERFGRGYGEENDLCERAKAKGFKVRLCDDLFVAHTGSASFGDERLALQAAALKALLALHPRYTADVEAFIARNPLARIQKRVAYHLDRLAEGDTASMLFVLHTNPFKNDRGGTEYHVLDLVSELCLPRAVVVYAQGDGYEAAEVRHGDIHAPVLHALPAAVDVSAPHDSDASIDQRITKLVNAFHVRAVHIHHTLGWPLTAWRVFSRHQLPVFVTLHDYYSICPNFNLLDTRTLKVCSCRGDLDEREACIRARCEELGTPGYVADPKFITRHREESEALLRYATSVIVPSEAAASIVSSYYPWLRPRVLPHGYDEAGVLSPGTSASEPLRVALIGAFASPWKGAPLYLEVMEALREQPLDWHLFGPTSAFGFDDEIERRRLGGHVKRHGPYERETIQASLAANRIDLALILPVCHETFCFTLSEAWLTGIPAVVSRLGAVAERVAASGAGVVVDSAAEAAAALSGMIADRALLAVLREKTRTVAHLSLAANARLHAAVYGEVLERVLEPTHSPVSPALENWLFDTHWRAQRARAAEEPWHSSLERPCVDLVRSGLPVLRRSLMHWTERLVEQLWREQEAMERDLALCVALWEVRSALSRFAESAARRLEERWGAAPVDAFDRAFVQATLAALHDDAPKLSDSGGEPRPKGMLGRTVCYLLEPQIDLLTRNQTQLFDRMAGLVSASELRRALVTIADHVAPAHAVEAHDAISRRVKALLAAWEGNRAQALDAPSLRQYAPRMDTASRWLLTRYVEPLWSACLERQRLLSRGAAKRVRRGEMHRLLEEFTAVLEGVGRAESVVDGEDDGGQQVVGVGGG